MYNYYVQMPIVVLYKQHLLLKVDETDIAAKIHQRQIQQP